MYLLERYHVVQISLIQKGIIIAFNNFVNHQKYTLFFFDKILEEIYIIFSKLGIDFGHVAHLLSNISITPKLGIMNNLSYKFFVASCKFEFFWCLEWLVYLLERFCVMEIVVTPQKWSSFCMK
jgi:hypothetical protein